MDLSAARDEYESKGLSEGDVDPEPMAQLSRWFEEVSAAEYFEPEAMIVATVDDEGNPQVRTVLCRGVALDGVRFFTNYESAKGSELRKRPSASLLFTWVELRRQVRVEGMAELLTTAENDAYFASRPRGSQLGAWASRQSEVVESRAALETAFEEVAQRFEGLEVPRPDHWGGFLVRPSRVEFWQGRENRMHDRLRYERNGERWIIERLAP
ncbi:MAG: pyridoxamine 5'-phosphate oxidase [Acidobacteria bacterium]|nr:pyridoxamine 5'-phosphate oxidase [Acidobacteriota bacterium]